LNQNARLASGGRLLAHPAVMPEILDAFGKAIADA
jgi:hypothetical protein